MGKIYRHYGAAHHDINRKIELFSDKGINKPSGSLTWASPIDSECRWDIWCELEGFRDCSKQEYFDFTISDDSKILLINSDLSSLDNYIDHSRATDRTPYMLDWDMIHKEFDGVEFIKLNGMNMNEYIPYLFCFGSWDVDSIVIWNMGIIQEIKED